MILHPQESRWKRRRRSRTLPLKADSWLCSTRSKGRLRRQRRSPRKRSRPLRVSAFQPEGEESSVASICKHCVFQRLYTSRCFRETCSQREACAPHFPLSSPLKGKFQKHLKVAGGRGCSQDSRWTSAGSV